MHPSISQLYLDFDTSVKRAKVPSTALPPDIRKKLGFKEKRGRITSKTELLGKPKEETNQLAVLTKKSFLKKGSRCKQNVTPTKNLAPMNTQFLNDFGTFNHDGK